MFYKKLIAEGEGYHYEYEHMDRFISVKNSLGYIQRSIRDSKVNIIKEFNHNFYDSNGYLVTYYIAFCQTTKKPVNLDEYKFYRLFYVISNSLTVGCIFSFGHFGVTFLVFFMRLVLCK